jgi:hypothetical protein
MIDRSWGGMMVLGLALLGACAGQEPMSQDPLTDFQNPRMSVRDRIEALDRAWEESGPTGREETRQAIKAIAWAPEAPPALRLAAIRKLVDDPDEADDARKTARLMIPLEPDLDVVEVLGDAAARHGWTDLTPALVRSYSRPGKGPDAERPERAVLLALNPGRSVERIAFEVFLRPAPEGVDDGPGSNFGLDYAQRTRSGAWNLLARLDADGSARASMLTEEFARDASMPRERVLDDLRACLNDLRTVPISGEEMLWLASLRNPGDDRNAAWWAEAASAIARLTPEQSKGLRLRHAESVRWAGTNRVAWLAADRTELLAELGARLKGRDIHERGVRDDESRPPVAERLRDWESQLSWGDVLGILAIDEAMRQPGVIGPLFEQARDDLADRTTEYGGLLILPSPAFAAVLYPPRPSQRLGDDQFVASADMMAQGDRAAAHYHFHVSRSRNSSYSGPSEGDLAYATGLGRACVVFTSLGPGVLGADYYQPGGVVIDLGELRAPGR